MKKNMGNADRGIRLGIALLIVILYFAEILQGTLAYILLALSTIFVLTSFVSFCPLYAPFGLSTCKRK
ncbi:MAG: DUF2892 domain-containing protein [Winogradskyella sp.]|nr:DUF2892 domain-containing protein [Winogradskyella sp.]